MLYFKGLPLEAVTGPVIFIVIGGAIVTYSPHKQKVALKNKEN
jgi:hypothetical protein